MEFFFIFLGNRNVVIFYQMLANIFYSAYYVVLHGVLILEFDGRWLKMVA